MAYGIYTLGVNYVYAPPTLLGRTVSGALHDHAFYCVARSSTKV